MTRRRLHRRPCPTCRWPIDRGPGQHLYCSEDCRPMCAFEGCHKLSQTARSLCEAHYMQTIRGKELKPLAYANEWVCVVCGVDVPKGSGRRRHCSSRCQALHSRNRNRPKSFICAICNIEVSLICPSTKTGQFKRSDAYLCNQCKPHTRYGMNPRQLAKRDGTDCKICGEPVDMDALKSDIFRPSVDHILPRSAGGTDDSTNLQLAHLWCNQVMNRRKDFSLVIAQRGG